MSNVLEEMKTRRSIRKFKPDAIPQEILDQIIEAGTYAANGRGEMCIRDRSYTCEYFCRSVGRKAGRIRI